MTVRAYYIITAILIASGMIFNFAKPPWHFIGLVMLVAVMLLSIIGTLLGEPTVWKMKVEFQALIPLSTKIKGEKLQGINPLGGFPIVFFWAEPYPFRKNILHEHDGRLWYSTDAGLIWEPVTELDIRQVDVVI